MICRARVAARSVWKHFHAATRTNSSLGEMRCVIGHRTAAGGMFMLFGIVHGMPRPSATNKVPMNWPYGRGLTA
jgi:hypothetical protein